MRSPISFKDWLFIVGIVFVAGMIFFWLNQIPFFNSILTRMADFTQTEYLRNGGFYSD